MRDSNWTLRWHRTARDAYGHEIDFDTQDSRDSKVLMVALFALGFIAGLLAGGGGA